METYKAFKFRLYPTQEQKAYFNKIFGCCRFIYNYYLDLNNKLYEEQGKGSHMSKFDCMADLTQLKKKEEYSWLQEVPVLALRGAITNLDNAFTRFFNRDKYPNQDIGYPQFKKKNHHSSFTMAVQQKANGNFPIYIDNGRLVLEKRKNIAVKMANLDYVPDPFIPKSITVSMLPSGQYYASIVCKVDIKELPKNTNAVGIDFGTKNFCTLSTGEKIDNPLYLKKSLDKLAKLKREHARKEKGSANREKARLKVARMEQKISNQRMDFANKLSTRLIRENGVICMENFNIKDLLEDVAEDDKHAVARTIQDSSWGRFRADIDYKARWYGRKSVKLPKDYPSNQTCRICGYQNPDMRECFEEFWTCPNCETVHDRTLNSAMNILDEGIRMLVNGEEEE